MAWLAEEVPCYSQQQVYGLRGDPKYFGPTVHEVVYCT